MMDIRSYQRMYHHCIQELKDTVPPGTCTMTAVIREAQRRSGFRNYDIWTNKGEAITVFVFRFSSDDNRVGRLYVRAIRYDINR